ncbi:MAG: hypothetical protein R3C46_01440 [Hyphomonadaceae bacterium]
MPRSQQSPLKLTIYASGLRKDFRASQPGISDSVLGFYDAGIEEIRAVTTSNRDMERQRDMPRNARALDARTVLLHEYAHHHMRANNRAAFPAWYVEGFAEFLSTAEFNDNSADIGKVTFNRASWIVDGDWMAIEPFLTKHPREFATENEVAQFYAQSWLAAHYLFSTPERAKGFDNYTRALQQGGDLLGAFQPSFGIAPEDFDKELRDYKRKPIRYYTLPDARPDSSSITAIRLSRVADEVLVPASYLRSLPSRERAEETVALIRDQAKKHPDSPYVSQCVALADIWYGDLDAARVRLDELLVQRPSTPDIHHLSGLCYLRAGRKQQSDELIIEAQDAFGRAHQLDDGRPQTMYRYVESGLALTGMDEHLLNVLVGAYQLAPQVDPIALTCAQALIQHKRFEEAVTVLRPLTAELHGGDMPALARDLTDIALAEGRTTFSFYGAAMIGEE